MVRPARWYYLKGQHQHGPMGLTQIRELVLEGELRPDTYVWADGMPDWLYARQVPALTPPPSLREDLPAWR